MSSIVSTDIPFLVLPPSPPAEKAAACQDEAGEASTNDWTRNGGQVIDLDVVHVEPGSRGAHERYLYDTGHVYWNKLRCQAGSVGDRYWQSDLGAPKIGVESYAHVLCAFDPKTVDVHRRADAWVRICTRKPEPEVKRIRAPELVLYSG